MLLNIIYIFASVRRGCLPFNKTPIFRLNSCFFSISRIISSDSQGSNLSSNIVLRRGLPRTPGLDRIPGLAREGLARAIPPSLFTGVVGGTLDLDNEPRDSGAGESNRVPWTDCTLRSNAVTLLVRICKRENTLLMTLYIPEVVGV